MSLSKAYIKELLTTGTGTEGSLLIPKTLYANLVEAVSKKRIGRQLAAIYFGPSSIKGSSIDINTVDPDSMKVHKIAEGASIPIDVVNYSSFNLKPDKYGVRPTITKEMMEDSLFPLLEHNIRTAGIEMAENEDSLIVTDAMDSASNTITGGAAITIANITRGIQYLEDSDHKATTMLCGPEVANDIRNIEEFIHAEKFGSPEMQRNGFIGQILGMDVFVISTSSITTTTAYIFDREHGFVIAEKRPVSIERYNDISTDISGATITQRVKIRQLRAAAIAKITTT